jgi:uncharacterized protein (TIGR03437 family)
VAVGSNRTDLRFTVSTSEIWIKVTPAQGSVPATLSISVEPTWRGAGLYNGSVRVSAYSLATYEGVSASVAVHLNVIAAEPPPALTAVVNAASFLAGPVAPGEIVTVFGSRLGPRDLTRARLNAAGLVDTSLAGTRLLFDGVAAPMVYTSQSQASAVVPYGVANRRTTAVQAEYQGRKSESLTLAVAAADPAIFTLGSSGGGQGAILNQDGSLNSSSIPAEPGFVVVLFATGEGQTIPAGVDGKPAAEPLPRPILPVSARIDGIPAHVLYAGGAPGLVAGVLQVNVVVPEGVGSGDVPVVLKVGDAHSPAGVTLAATRGDHPVAANLSVSFSPNPVSRSPDGFWYFRITLTETRGVGLSLSRWIVNGSDWTPFMSSVFPTARIAGNSRMSVDVKAPCGIPCPQRASDTLWEIFGSDETGHGDLRWTAVLRLIP